MIFSKIKIIFRDIIDISLYKFIRICPVIIYNDFKIIAVHLEIGERYHHLKKNDPRRKRIEKYNRNLRIKQLEQIFAKYSDIDVIIGDFNFTSNDGEFKWLINKGFIYCEDYMETTPYNRTDMIFINKNTRLKKI
jgi:hypothetical protein